VAASARIWLIVIAILVLAAAGALTAVAVFSHERDQGLIPDRVQPGPQAHTSAPAAPPARCPAGLAGCRTVEGQIIYVEAVDPDGDGDAHFVLADTGSVTGPGITAVDVRRDLRPNPLPGIGAHLSAAGTIETGSYGQHQIAAVKLGG
jgi:hypothetical protein